MIYGNQKQSTFHRNELLATGDESPDERKRRQRLTLFQRSGLLAEDNSGCVHERAVRSYDLECAYRLVYDVFLKCGYVTPSNVGLRMRAFELCPETATFVSKSPSSSVVGVLSVVEDSSDLGLPSDGAFKDELDRLRQEGGKLCEFSNQAVVADFRRTGVSAQLMRCAYAQSFYVGCTDIVCSVSPKMVPFYDLIGFEVVSDVKSYSTVLDDPVVLMRLPRIQTRWTTDPPSRDPGQQFCRIFFHHANPFMAQMPVWMSLNERMFSEPMTMSALFGKCPDLTMGASDPVRSALKRRLGVIYDMSERAAERISERPLPPYARVDRPNRVSFGPRPMPRTGSTGRFRPMSKLQFRSFDRAQPTDRLSTPPPMSNSARIGQGVSAVIRRADRGGSSPADSEDKS